MSKYLTVTYYPNKNTAKLAERIWDGNGMPRDEVSQAYASKVEFDSDFGDHNIDIGDYNNYKGTYEKFTNDVTGELAKYSTSDMT